MNTLSTATTRPRTSFGAATAAIVLRMLIAIMSTKPLDRERGGESGNERERPKTTAAPNAADHDEQRRAGVAAAAAGG